MTQRTKTPPMHLNQRKGRFDNFDLRLDMSSGKVTLEKSQRASQKNRTACKVRLAIHKNDLRMVAEQLIEAARFLDKNDFEL